MQFVCFASVYEMLVLSQTSEFLKINYPISNLFEQSLSMSTFIKVLKMLNKPFLSGKKNIPIGTYIDSTYMYITLSHISTTYT